jgi:hypothetical protein
MRNVQVMTAPRLNFFFDEMQNGAIWDHFRVSYNIESSTILMTDRQEFLPFKIMACSLLSLSYAPDVNFELTTPFLSDQKKLDFES